MPFTKQLLAFSLQAFRLFPLARYAKYIGQNISEIGLFNNDSETVSAGGCLYAAWYALPMLDRMDTLFSDGPSVSGTLENLSVISIASTSRTTEQERFCAEKETIRTQLAPRFGDRSAHSLREFFSSSSLPAATAIFRDLAIGAALLFEAASSRKEIVESYQNWPAFFQVAQNWRDCLLELVIAATTLAKLANDNPSLEWGNKLTPVRIVAHQLQDQRADFLCNWRTSRCSPLESPLQRDEAPMPREDSFRVTMYATSANNFQPSALLFTAMRWRC
jgi:hypothetical protein